MRNDQEYLVYRQLAQYMKDKYPQIIFRFDMAGNNLSKAQAGKNKAIQFGKGFPDFFIAQPSGSCHGLYIEVKKEGEKIYLKDGITLVANEHVHEQNEMLINLRLRGYEAHFGIGFAECKLIVEEYLKDL